MKIAVPSDQGQVAGHFGHCEDFVVFDVEDKKVVGVSQVPNPGHVPGFLPRFLGEQGVDVVIAGGMGQSAVTLFEEQGIEVCIGAKGSPQDVVNLFLEGKADFTGDACQDHH